MGYGQVAEFRHAVHEFGIISVAVPDTLEQLSFQCYHPLRVGAEAIF